MISKCLEVGVIDNTPDECEEDYERHKDKKQSSGSNWVPPGYHSRSLQALLGRFTYLEVKCRERDRKSTLKLK
jgi:hypothetical protein